MKLDRHSSPVSVTTKSWNKPLDNLKSESADLTKSIKKLTSSDVKSQLVSS